MYPTIEDIRKIAAKGQYKRVPVCREVYADRYTPVEAMRTLRKASRHCYLLESASQTEVWGTNNGDYLYGWAYENPAYISGRQRRNCKKGNASG